MNVTVSCTTEPAENLAEDERLLRACGAGEIGDTLRLWVNDECLVRGVRRHERYGWYREEVADEMRVRVFARESAGGCVYQDGGNLNWSFYLRRSDTFAGIKSLFRPCAEAIASALLPLGIRAAFGPPNRIDLAGQKISGLAARAVNRASLVHGTLLVATDLERLNRLCIPPLDCPPVTNLSSERPGLTVPRVVEALTAAFAGASPPGLAHQQ